MKYSLIYQFLGGYYHQDVWEDYETDDQIWTQFKNDCTIEERHQIINEISDALKIPEYELMNVMSECTRGGGISFEVPEKAKLFLNDLKEFLLI